MLCRSFCLYLSFKQQPQTSKRHCTILGCWLLPGQQFWERIGSAFLKGHWLLRPLFLWPSWECKVPWDLAFSVRVALIWPGLNEATAALSERRQGKRRPELGESAGVEAWPEAAVEGWCSLLEGRWFSQLNPERTGIHPACQHLCLSACLFKTTWRNGSFH